MPINTQSLFDQKRLQFGQGVTGNRFTSDFVQAVNRVLDELKARAHLSGTKIENIQTDIDLNDKFTYAVSIGIDYHLLHMGGYAGDVRMMKQLWDDAWKTCQCTYFKDAQDDGTLEVKLGDLTGD